jgi:hypothetical protein
MSVVNRRNAVVGWLVIVVGKRVLRKKAREAVPALDPETKRPNKSLVAVAIASTAGAVTFWRLRSRGDDPGSSAE